MLGVHDAETAKRGGCITPRNACTAVMQHGIHEKSPVFYSGCGLSCLARWQTMNTRPLPGTYGHIFCLFSSLGVGAVAFNCAAWVLIDDIP